MTEKHVKKLDASVQESKLQRASKERKSRALEVELTGVWSTLQTELLRESKLESHPGQRVVVNLSVKSKTVAALKVQISALRGQVKAIKDEVG